VRKTVRRVPVLLQQVCMTEGCQGATRHRGGPCRHGHQMPPRRHPSGDRCRAEPATQFASGRGERDAVRDGLGSGRGLVDVAGQDWVDARTTESVVIAAEAARARKPEYPVEFMHKCRIAYFSLANLLGGWFGATLGYNWGRAVRDNYWLRYLEDRRNGVAPEV